MPSSSSGPPPPPPTEPPEPEDDCPGDPCEEDPKSCECEPEDSGGGASEDPGGEDCGQS